MSSPIPMMDAYVPPTPPTMDEQLVMPGQVDPRLLISSEMRDLIDKMSHTEIASLLRFGKSGNPLLEGKNFEVMNARFQSLGGWTPEISKAVGW